MKLVFLKGQHGYQKRNCQLPIDNCKFQIEKQLEKQRPPSPGLSIFNLKFAIVNCQFISLILPLMWVIFPGSLRAQEPKPAKVPFDLLLTQHMTVEIKINGKGPFRMIFDTGAPVMLLNNKVAKEAGVIPKDFKPPVFALFGGVGQFKIKSFELGDLKAEQLPTMVMDHPTVSAMAKILGPIEGIVGFSFFARYRMTIDYQTKTMTFVPTDYNPPDMMERLKKMILLGAKDTKKVLAPAGLWGFRVDKEARDEDPGVVVQNVLAGSPAAEAGLKIGDRLLTLDSRWTDTVTDCYAAAGFVRPGTTARLLVRREGKEMELTVKVASGL